MGVYRVLKWMLRLAVSIFYKEVHVEGHQLLPAQGPLIVAVNHPNTLMDPMVVALQLKQRTGFLANGGIFANSFLKWLFAKLHLIPIYRPKDVKEGEVPDNRASFRQCYDYLLKKGTIIIFPEGSSINEMKLRKLKTGTARIALETAALSNFTSGLMIAPVALNYTDPIHFNSRLFVRIDKPIAVDGYAAAYQADPVAAVHALTEQLTLRLQQNLILIENKEQEVMLRRVRKLYRDEQQAEKGLSIEGEDEFLLQQQIAGAMKCFQVQHPQDYQRVKKKLNDYFDLIEQKALKEGFFSKGIQGGKKRLLLAGNLLFLILLFPLYLLGLLTNYPPYILPSKIADNLGIDIEYRAGIMMLSGLLLFPIYYALVIVAFFLYLTPSGLMTFLFALSLPLQGYFTLYYWRVFENTISLIKYLKLGWGQKELLQELAAKRQEIIRELYHAEVVLSTSSLGKEE